MGYGVYTPTTLPDGLLTWDDFSWVESGCCVNWPVHWRVRRSLQARPALCIELHFRSKPAPYGVMKGMVRTAQERRRIQTRSPHRYSRVLRILSAAEEFLGPSLNPLAGLFHVFAEAMSRITADTDNGHEGGGKQQ